MYIIASIGQILFGLFWLSSSYNHFSRFTMMTGYVGSKKVPFPKLAIAISGVLLLVGGLGIITGLYVWWAILALVVFLVPVTFIMHNFWADTDPQAKMSNRGQFMKNMALLGALLILWQFSVLAYSF